MFLNIDILDNLWLPEFYIHDLKYFEKKKTIKSQDSLLVFKTQESNLIKIQYSFQPEIGFVCPIDYKKFPFQNPVCEMKISSNIEFNKTLIFKVSKRKVIYEEAKVCDQLPRISLNSLLF